MIIFGNFEELQNNDEKLANELLQERGAGEWQAEEIYYYKDLEEFADYELREGWYASFFGNISKGFNGAPDPFDYIDLKELGADLAANWDESEQYLSDSGEVLQTGYGW